jgi:hypothetical protein
MRLLATILFALLATTVAAQQRQPAQLTTQPSLASPTLDALDKAGGWNKLGQFDSTNHVFSSYNSDAVDIRQFGCVADGSACINNAISKTPGCVLIPATQEGFFVAAGSTINAGKCLKGEFFTPGYTHPYASYPNELKGRAWIKCATSTTSVCVRSEANAAYIANLNIATNFPPALGSIGLQVKDGYNAQIRDIAVSGFDRCAMWGPAGALGINGLSSHVIGLNLSWCQTYYLVQDGWPELYITDGRWGSNGQGATAVTPKAMVYITKSTDAGAGGGPNSLVMTNVQVNPGDAYVECMVLWGGETGTGGQTRYFRFIGNHWEFRAPPPSAPAKKGIFCSDSTVEYLGQLQVTDSSFQFDDIGGGGVFNFDPATSIHELSITNSYLAADFTTLNLGPGNTPATASFISNTFLGGPLTLVGRSDSYLSLTNTVHANINLSGTWGQLSLVNPIFATLTDTARGNVSYSGSRNQAWTPVIKFGGVTSTRTWNSGGITARTANGGFITTVVVEATGGTETASGNMTITGTPYTCSAGFGVAPVTTEIFTASGVGQVLFGMDGSSPAVLYPVKNGAAGTGYVNLTPADIITGTRLEATVECQWAN